MIRRLRLPLSPRNDTLRRHRLAIYAGSKHSAWKTDILVSRDLGFKLTAFFARGMSPSEVECCFKQILRGVEYLHTQGVAHRDIKPENLFFDTKGNLKVRIFYNTL